ncbi:hypothetical protein [Nannocystis sp. SCPEA4]|uniref:hypothetical protein n=1 Tax=Nannocystis sp. SCPEA4 TaxID=2996787 RepID=UPI0022712BF4|nr:hypothetical protein [Nannocystis sp. SCPEA4]MCY1057382.1 hypothetical protein [Nannocystis sp. SCPEA4]
MSKIRHAPYAISFAVAGAWLCACSPGAESRGYGSYVDFTTANDTRRLCSGSMPHLEHYIDRAFDFFGTETPEDLHIPLLVGDPESPCTELFFSTSCYVAAEETIYLADLDLQGRRTHGIIRHELTHAVIDRMWGQSAPFFNEGLAESLSRTLVHSWSASEPLEPVGDMLGSVPAEVEYTAAAYFTRFLIDTRGLAPFKKLFQAARGRSREEIEALMAEIYGESFAALEAEYLSGPARCQYQLDVCEPGSAESVGAGFHLTRAASCDDPDFYGSIGSDDLDIATQQTLAVAVSGTYRLRVDYDVPLLSADYPRSQVRLTRCGECDEQSVQMFHRTDEELELEAGLYALEIVMPFDTVVSIDLELLDP